MGSAVHCVGARCTVFFFFFTAFLESFCNRLVHVFRNFGQSRFIDGRNRVMRLVVSAAIQKTDAPTDDFRDVAINPVLVRPLPRPQKTFNVDETALADVGSAVLGIAPVNDHGMPISDFNALAVGIRV